MNILKKWYRVPGFAEGNSVIDTVSPSFYHIDQIYNASTGEHEDFTRETELLLEWQNPDTGEWVPFDTPKFNSEFNGSCIICLHKFQTRTSREGVWSPWKGPWQQVQVLYQ